LATRKKFLVWVGLGNPNGRSVGGTTKDQMRFTSLLSST